MQYMRPYSGSDDLSKTQVLPPTPGLYGEPPLHHPPGMPGGPPMMAPGGRPYEADDAECCGLF
eukprot:CAMPEP_0113828784 /NCGR_PEP_ID=MMETSP0328-20130328/5459_1 /TAXON_ID=39455 /ORGANISM="Alexandrium minutum" /LENGTH=62 /DNA_ID=CAMNT_0000796811 /DNA_START=57 /DNA_END=245 /DNA_ORIENTATION=+ /assembly_acc=CAM_ASM_000350